MSRVEITRNIITSSTPRDEAHCKLVSGNQEVVGVREKMVAVGKGRILLECRSRGSLQV